MKEIKHKTYKKTPILLGLENLSDTYISSFSALIKFASEALIDTILLT